MASSWGTSWLTSWLDSWLFAPPVHGDVVISVGALNGVGVARSTYLPASATVAAYLPGTFSAGALSGVAAAASGVNSIAVEVTGL